ncbi:Gag/polymerase/env polyprotein, partial [Globisporangium splendens]
MGKRKTRESELVGSSFAPLSNNAENLDRLRTKFSQALERQFSLIKYMHNEIPNCHSHVERNALQELTDRLLSRLNQVETLITTFADRKIKEVKSDQEERNTKKSRTEQERNTIRNQYRQINISERKQRLMEVLAHKETRVEGISLPHFSGAIGESVDLYFNHVMRSLAAKNINWEDESNGPRIVAMMTANFRGNAAAWYMLNRDKVSDVQELTHHLTKEFVPRDKQHRLRDKLYNLRQSRCHSLEGYIGKYRMLLMQIREISELDKITYFTRDLLS